MQQRVKETMHAIATVIEHNCGHGWDVTLLAVAIGHTTVPQLRCELNEWEECCTQYGFEYVDAEAHGQNQFGGKLPH